MGVARLQFEEAGEDQAQAPGAAKPASIGSAESTKSGKTPASGQQNAKPTALPAGSAAPSGPSVASESPAAPTEPDPDKPAGGGEVVRLDRFRKK